MTKPKGKTIDDLRALHDKNVVIPNRIRDGLAKVVASGDEWLYESDFLKLTGISVTDIAKFREEFTDFWSEVPAAAGKNTIRRVWFATKKAADAWKAL